MNNAVHSDDVKKFATAAKRVLGQIKKYIDTTSMYDSAYNETEFKLAAARDRLEDKLRPLGLSEHAESLALMSQVKQAWRDCREAAAKNRQAQRDAEMNRLKDQIRDERIAREERCPGITQYERELASRR